MDIDTEQLKAALESDILILDCRRDGKFTKNVEKHFELWTLVYLFNILA